MSTDNVVCAASFLPLVYSRLRRLADSYLRDENSYHTLQPTALVHEAYLRLAERHRIAWQGKTHFLAVAAVEMRRVLVDHARGASAQKRGARPRRITLTDRATRVSDQTVEILALHESLDKLERRSPRQARVVEMRVFAGMSTAEIAESLAIAPRTVRGDWQVARLWLAREMRVGEPV